VARCDCVHCTVEARIALEGELIVSNSSFEFPLSLSNLPPQIIGLSLLLQWVL
jgi:hypothetical protein